jgi:acyl transferase domain-containing protein/NAD(P)H-dependent flavin oxidoreductase YrpB (nitropropane dioxygenase family)/NAD(P)-dependent dehydrogenase (short-subunit alcohol dehydrogenase family)
MDIDSSMLLMTDAHLKQRFTILSPFNSPNALVVRAAINAGFWSILDMGDPQDKGVEYSLKQLQTLTSNGSFGVRLPRSLTQQRWRPHHLTEWVKRGLIDQVIIDEGEDWGSWASLRAVATQKLEVWVEVRSLEGALRVDEDERISGMVVVAEEAAGFCGEYSAYIWLQKLAQMQVKKPYWLRGGMTLSGMIAALCFGAERVVLDEHLVGCVELELPDELQAIFSRVGRSHSLKVQLNDQGNKSHLKRDRFTSIRALNWPKSHFWQLMKQTDVNQAISHAAWGSHHGHRIMPLSASWPQINRSYRTLLKRWDRAPRCVDILDHIISEISSRLEILVQQRSPLCPPSELAKKHGIQFPIFQGPMTRVSDIAEFAFAVSEGGALPFIALSLLNEKSARSLLEKTQKSLGKRSWGIGILGFSPPEIREIHLKLIREFKPSAVLIAGGRPSQSRALEGEGIPTYLHAPAPELLESFLEEGARRFIFEGSECGGHIGPSTSFALWDAQLDVLERSPYVDEVDAIFAGGIHDPSSAGVLIAMCGRISKLGAKVGALMGTGYLFTKEAVETGAILPKYQEVALSLKETSTLDTAPGHTTRCASTEFIDVFEKRKAELLDQGVQDRELWSALEQFNVGRLRVASKGLARRGNQLISVDQKEQQESGMYMIGEVATLRDQQCTIKTLHDQVSLESEDWLKERLSQFASVKPSLQVISESEEDDIAIIGISCLFPKAKDHQQFWSNILEGVDAIQEIPSHRWSVQQYYDPEASPGSKSASKWGGFLDPVPFDPMKFGIPPQTLTAVEPVQLLSLEVAASALEDAGYAAIPKKTKGRSFNREMTSVIFGAEAGTDLAAAYSLRSVFPQWLGALPSELDERLPTLTEDSFAGVLANVISGRIANRLDLGGVNFTVDAACASSLAALDNAVKSLRSAESDMVICGGADLHNSINDYLMFSSVHALSKTGRCRPFDQGADGISLGEGVAAVILKRANDARRDGDRIYARISSVAGSSDGKALGLTAPRHEGQQRAIKRAYQRAGLSTHEVELIEAHGTGTIVGDRTELQALTELFLAEGQTQTCTLGSVKSMIGHTKCAAGLAGLIKVSMSLYHKVRPPTLHIETPNQAYEAIHSPFCFERGARPWIAEDGTRVGGVSAFGFGGTNFHAVLREETVSNKGAQQREVWSSEPILLMGNSIEDARTFGLEVAESLGKRREMKAAANLTIRSLAYSIYRLSKDRFKSTKLQALLWISSLEEAEEGLRHFASDQAHACLLKLNVPLSEEIASSQTAFVFPGQGAQRVSMMRDLFISFPHLTARLNESVEHAQLIFPSHPIDRQHKRSQQEALTDTRNAQPALGICDLAMHDLLSLFGVQADHLAGHSYGELVALCVAGILPDSKLSKISAKRGELILNATGALDADGGDPGSMAAIVGRAEEVRQALNENARFNDVTLANLNAPTQTVISGPTSQIGEAIELLKKAGLSGRKIPVACAFHSTLVSSAATTFQQYLESVLIDTNEWGRKTVWSNQTAQKYKTDSEHRSTIPELLGSHLASPVRFVEQITSMINEGVRVFVEVGPGRILSGLIEKISAELDLSEQIYTVPCAPNKGELREFVLALAQLSRLGMAVDWDQIWRGRKCEAQTIEALNSEHPSPLLWWVDGMRAWPNKGPLPKNYLNPPLTPLKLANMKSEMKEDEMKSTISKPPQHRLSLEEAQPQPTDDVAIAAKAYFESMKSLAQAQERVMLALLGQAEGIQSLPAGLSVEEGVPHPPSYERTSAPKPVVDQNEVIDFWSNTSINTEASSDHKINNTEIISEQGSQTSKLDSFETLSIKDTLIELVSERTGYPVDMLNIDLDLEADLSVDSIKRIEILGVLAEKLGISESSESERDLLIEELAVMKTLSEMIEWLEAKLSQNQADEELQAQDMRPKSEGEPLPRAIRQWAVAPLKSNSHLLTSPSSSSPSQAVPYHVFNLIEQDSLHPLDDLFNMLKQLWGSPTHLAGILVFAPLCVTHQDALKWGGVSGLLKSASREWLAFSQAINIRLVYVSLHIDHPQDIIGAEEAQFTVDLQQPETHELSIIRYRSAGARERESYEEKPLKIANQRPLPQEIKSEVILATGGARGVTARCIVQLARQSPEKTFILIGRTPHPKHANSSDLNIAKAVDSERELRSQLAKHSIDLDFQLLKQRAKLAWAQMEVADTIATLTKIGARCVYLSIDLNDLDDTSFRDQLNLLLDRESMVAEEITTVIHAAGVIDDQRIHDKTLARFHQVIKPKVDGVRLLLNSLPKASRWLFFSSVAAALGNQGQSDYAAANSVLDQLAECLCEQNGPDDHHVYSARSIQWGPWRGAGMVDMSLAQVYEDRGVQMISLEEGVTAFMDEWSTLSEPGMNPVALRTWPFSIEKT